MATNEQPPTDDQPNNTDRSDNDDPREPDGLEPAQAPYANASNLVRGAYKDHKNALNAFLWEFGQNGIDAFLWAVHAGKRENTTCTINFRANPDDNTFEMWDNAVGMDRHKLKRNYLSLGHPGSEKQQGTEQKDTGGSQGKGFWAMCGWCTDAYVETHDANGNVWSGRAYPLLIDENISEIREVNTPRPEIRDGPGTYVRLEGIDPDDMEDLVDIDRAIEKIERKFAFALSNPKRDIRFRYEVDGTVREAEGYDFANIVEQAAVVHKEDLNTFHLQGKDRQLTDLTLIDNRELPADFEPPWTGVAMLKGGEYTDSIPYMTVWPYVPNDVDEVRDGKLWGWVDASSLCPDREEHGHTGFNNTDRIYGPSGLRKRIIETCNDLFAEETVEEDTESGERALEHLVNFLDEFDTYDTDGPDRTGEPDDPKIHMSTDGYYYDVGDYVPFYTLITNPSHSDTEEFHIKGEVQRVLDEDGNEIPEKDRDEPRPFDDAGSVPISVTRHRIKDDPPKYPARREGGFEVRLELRPAPDVEGEPGDFGYQMALDQKPLYDTTVHTFYVGDVETKSGDSTSTTSTTTSSGGAGDVINSVGFIDKPDSSNRVNIKSQSDGTKNVLVNKAHPDFKRMNDLMEGLTESEVKTEVGVRWAFGKIFIQRVENEISELLEEHRIENSELRVGIENSIRDRLVKLDEFAEEFSEIGGGKA